ncbi:hypothetical protein V496_01945 [Pseudogymnoascus sp. VKM F-4515 (FW-2607)]|nr:hypothetical protein V496_01945 [Pseudogymnoascus sp. VKM F-4515 (FW-2607)]
MANLLPMTQERDCGYVGASPEGSLDKPRPGPTSDEGMRICGPPVLDGAQRNRTIRLKSDIGTAQPVSRAQHQMSSDEQESADGANDDKTCNHRNPHKRQGRWRCPWSPESRLADPAR